MDKFHQQKSHNQALKYIQNNSLILEKVVTLNFVL